MNDFKNFLREYPIPSLVGLISFIFFFAVSHTSETKREHNIPLAFSEISHIEREDSTLTPINRVLPMVNDLTMKVFEAYNNTHRIFGFSHEIFAQELEYHIANEYKWTKYNIPALHREISKEFPPLVDRHYGSLKSLQMHALSAKNNIAQLWKYSSTDH